VHRKLAGSAGGGVQLEHARERQHRAVGRGVADPELSCTVADVDLRTEAGGERTLARELRVALGRRAPAPSVGDDLHGRRESMCSPVTRRSNPVNVHGSETDVARGCLRLSRTMSPRLSIVVPVYNGERDLAGCLDSIRVALDELAPAAREGIEVI